jgi:hypothetical protein
MGTSMQQPEPGYSPGTAVPPAKNLGMTATSPDWSRFSGEPPQAAADSSDSTETAVHKAIEA